MNGDFDYSNIENYFFADHNSIKNFIIDGQQINTKFWHNKDEPETLLVGFHGAVNREKRQIPALLPFVPSRYSHSHQLMIGDPSLRCDDNLSVSWYAGDEQFNTQRSLVEFINTIIGNLNIKKIVFLGGSAGGFASLYYSYHFENSIALVANPQTSIDNYYDKHVKLYKEACWPNLSSSHKIGDLICSNICNLYKNNFKNTIIYMQSNTDYFHLSRHMAPFIEAIKNNLTPSFLPIIDNWGNQLGHSLPTLTMRSWLKTISLTDDLSIESLLDTRFKYFEHESLNENTAFSLNSGKKVSAQTKLDIKLSKSITTWLLSQ